MTPMTLRRATMAILVLVSCLAPALSSADPRQVQKLRRFYQDHGLDFFGDLIVDQKDVLEDEKRHAKVELMADDARMKALAQIDMLLKTASPSMRAELLIRKATLLSDRARTATFFQNAQVRSSKLKQPATYLRQSIENFVAVERQFPGHPRMDTILFSIAYNYGEMGKQHVDSCFTYYAKMTKRFPESPLVGDARLAMAEILFDKRRFKEALGQLQEIVKSEDGNARLSARPRLKNFALYKMGWTYFNLGDLESAIHALERTVEGVNASGVQRARLELRREALHDLVAFYSERPDAEAPREAVGYFERVARTPLAIAAEYAAERRNGEETLSEPLELLLRLSHVYRDQGKHQHVLILTGQLVGKLEGSAKVAGLYRLQAESAEKLRKRDLVLETLTRLAELLEREVPPVSAYRDGLPETRIDAIADFFSGKKNARHIRIVWTPARASEDPKTAHARELAAAGFETLREFATFFHGEYTKTGNADTGRQALALYDIAVKTLLEPWRGHDLAATFKLRAHRAHLRLSLKVWEGAAHDYRWLALHDSAAAVEHIRGEIAAREGWLKAAPVAIAKGARPGAIHQGLLEAYDLMLAIHFSGDPAGKSIGTPLAADVLAASARLLREHGGEHMDGALARMTHYSMHLSKEKDAAALTRDALTQLENLESWESLREYAGKLLETGLYPSQDLGRDIERAHEFASLKLLEEMEREKDWKGAAKGFALFATEHPKSPLRAQALMKSANASLQTQDAVAAVERLEEAARSDDEKIRLQAWLGLEPFYRKAFQWERLALAYEAIQKSATSTKARDGAASNLEKIRKLDPTAFNKTLTVPSDPELAAWLKKTGEIETAVEEFRNLRFTKSNRNPADNFKRKADQHARLVARVERIAEGAPKALRGAAGLWANVVKAEILVELAETLATAALPSALAGASDTDRKAYSETITGNVAELDAKARELSGAIIETSDAADSPLALETRINRLLAKWGAPDAVRRIAFADIWKNRPGQSPSRRTDKLREEIRKIGNAILEEKDASSIRQRTLELAHVYLGAEQTGFAHATAAELPEATFLLFDLDARRLPERIRGAIESERFTPETRWDLARWLQGWKSECLKKSEEDACRWFSDATRALLRVEPSKNAKRIQAAAFTR